MDMRVRCDASVVRAETWPFHPEDNIVLCGDILPIAKQTLPVKG